MTWTTRLAGAALSICLAVGGAGCGGNSTMAGHDAAAQHDAGGGDASVSDGGGGTDGSPGDAGAGDGGGDAGLDGGTAAALRQFVGETAGGARLQSAGYRMELFVAPSRPSGAGASSGYRMTLGPAAVRNAR